MVFYERPSALFKQPKSNSIWCGLYTNIEFGILLYEECGSCQSKTEDYIVNNI